MIPLSEWLRGVEGVGLVWLIAVCLLAGSLIRVVRHFRWPHLPRLHHEEQGASYTLSYVMVFPVYLLFVCLVVETSLLMLAKIGTLYAAHAGARSAAVWQWAQPTSARQTRIDQSVRTAMAPFAGFSNRISGAPPSGSVAQAAEYALALHTYAQASADQSPPPRPYTRVTPSISRYTTQYLVAASRINHEVQRQGTGDDTTIRCTVTYRAPLLIPGAAKILSPSGRAPWDYPITSIVTLPGEPPATPDEKPGIDYYTEDR
jgi:Flp pilus assembly protein TadG